ncbi:CLUMA_CG007173, isoform A [Clunio marinus]|uniref:CLUMA_CG007173, isoform A n=1 Tax=Clunio marinus TaxID=568069 RepID=A0A1J1I231_9DIPT|nr:CLUMA_CG007173, isoform A [Clunio marinus]
MQVEWMMIEVYVTYTTSFNLYIKLKSINPCVGIRSQTIKVFDLTQSTNRFLHLFLFTLPTQLTLQRLCKKHFKCGKNFT